MKNDTLRLKLMEHMAAAYPDHCWSDIAFEWTDAKVKSVALLERVITVDPAARRAAVAAYAARTA